MTENKIKKTLKIKNPKSLSGDKMAGVEYFNNKRDFEKNKMGTHQFLFKTTNKSFGSCENLNQFFKILKMPSNRGKVFENYEIIYSHQAVPLYFDIDFKNNDKDDLTCLDTLFYYLAKFMNESKLVEIESKDEPHLELMSKFSVSSATRIETYNNVNYWKHSYHFIMREPNMYFMNQAQILLFLNKFKEWVKINCDISDRCYLVSQEPGQNIKFIIDESIYSRQPEKLHGLRMIGSHKGENNSQEVLRKWVHPQMGGGYAEEANSYEDKDYYVNYIKKGSKWVKLPESWDFEETPKKICEMVPITQGLDEPPVYIKNKILSVLRNKFNNFEIINIKLINNVFFFNFETDEPCLLCGHSNERFSNKTRYTIQYNTTNANIIYFCRATKKNVKFHFNCEDNLLVPDYSYEDTEEIKCKPLLSIDKLGNEGTFLLEAAKGTGKSEAIHKFLSKVPEDKSILLISYRVSLVKKYVEELKKFKIRDYQLGFSDKSHFHRVAICKESLQKLCADMIGKYKYDIVIIDEIYSVLESWESKLKRDISDLMNIFDVIIRNAKYLYVMDAHINNSLVVNSLRILRKEEKFVFHKNPRLYDYSDYKVNWYENRDQDAYRGFQNMIIQELIDGKKIAVISATKTYVDETYSAVIKHNDISADLKKFKYTSSPEDVKIKDVHFADVEKYWSEKCVILYSPTISAGISYNKTGLEGFDKIYVYLTPTSDMTASINTFGQMLFRIRQLNDKELNIFFDTKKYRKCEIEEHQIEKRLEKRCSVLMNEFGLPLRNNGICLDTLRPLYDREHWSYNVWFETTKNKIRYSKLCNFKEYFKNLLCNSPSDKFAGRGMEFIDCSNNVITLEEEDKIFLDKLMTVDKRDKLDKDFTNYYLANDESNRHYLINVFGSSIKEFNKRCIELLKKNNLTPDEQIEYEKAKKFWKTIMGVGYQAKFRRLKNWVNNSNDESFTKLFKNYMKDSTSTLLFWDEDAKQLNVDYANKIKPQVIDGIMARGFHLTNILNDICGMLDIPKNTNLNGYKIKRSKFEESLNNRELINDIFNEIKNKTRLFKEAKRSYNLVLRKNIQRWQKANPNTCVYDLDSEGIKKFFKETGVNHNYQGFKPSEFKRGVKKKDEKIKEFMNGEWSFSDWKANDPYEFTIETFKNAISKVFECVLNCKLETVKNGSSYAWEEQRICNVFIRDGII